MDENANCDACYRGSAGDGKDENTRDDGRGRLDGLETGIFVSMCLEEQREYQSKGVLRDILL